MLYIIIHSAVVLFAMCVVIRMRAATIRVHPFGCQRGRAMALPFWTPLLFLSSMRGIAPVPWTAAKHKTYYSFTLKNVSKLRAYSNT